MNISQSLWAHFLPYQIRQTIKVQNSAKNVVILSVHLSLSRVLFFSVSCSCDLSCICVCVIPLVSVLI